jgi:hypothetical protein
MNSHEFSYGFVRGSKAKATKSAHLPDAETQDSTPLLFVSAPQPAVKKILPRESLSFTLHPIANSSFGGLFCVVPLNCQIHALTTDHPSRTDLHQARIVFSPQLSSRMPSDHRAGYPHVG